MILTPRILKDIWNTLRWKDVFRENAEAPTEEEFVRHFSTVNLGPMISWSQPANGLIFAYDASINQVQVMPPREPFVQRVEEANKWLWKLLPPELLDAPLDWSNLWFAAANRNDVEKMKFILEQGFNVNTVDGYGQTALEYAVVPYGGSFEMVTMLVDAGANLDTIEQLIGKAKGNATSANEAGEQIRIAKYLRSTCSHTFEKHE